MKKNKKKHGMMISKSMMPKNIIPKNIIPKNVLNAKNTMLARQAGIIVGAACAGATLAYFLDPDSGKKRRSMVLDKVNGAGLGVMSLSSEQWSSVSGFVKETLSKGLSFVKENFLSDENAMSPLEQGSADGMYATPAEAPEMNPPRSKKSYKSSYADKTDSAYPQ